MSRFFAPLFSRPLGLAFVVAAPFLTTPVVYGVENTATVVGTPTGLNPSYTNVDAASGLLTGDTDAGTPFGDSGLNPFNPPFQNTQLLIVQPSTTPGKIIFKLNQAVGGDGKIGVFTNTGISNVGTSEPTASMATPATPVSPAVPVQTLGQLSMAKVSVSSTLNGVYQPLFTGKAVTFDAPTNYYLDAPVTLDPDFGFAEQGLGTVIADQFKPFDTLDSTQAPPDVEHDPLSRFSGATYDQMIGTNTNGNNAAGINILNGSAGGTWFDLTGSGLDSIQYIEFDVPVGDRLAIDSVSAIPEPMALSTLALAGLLSLRRSR